MISSCGRATLWQRLAERTGDRGEDVSCRLFPRDGGEEILTGRQLVREAEGVAGRLAAAGLNPGERLLLALPLGRDLVVTFWAAVRLGLVPSIVNPSAERISAEAWRRNLLNIVTITGSKALVVADRTAAAEALTSAGLDDVRLLVPSQLPSPAPIAEPRDEAGAIALIQYSSGSTGLQKGVALDHGAILRQVDHYAAAIGFRPEHLVSSWLPLYHDMGLVAAFLMPLLSGGATLMIDPYLWASDPALLLEKIARHRATHCWQPNFAYSFLAQRVEEERSRELDLGSIESWFNCAEPIRAESHESFARRFAENGVRSETLGTCYAMAENVFAVTSAIHPRLIGIDAGEMAASGVARPIPVRDVTTRLVSSGRTINGAEIRIIDTAGASLPDKTIGEVAIRSDCLLAEYHRNPEATAAAFIDGWFKTGDLGFILEGDLFVTGRRKDLIILGGRNIFPQDVEDIVGAIDGVAPGRVAVVGEDDAAKGSQRLIVLAELLSDDHSPAPRIVAEVKRLVYERLDIAVDEIHLLPPRWLEKTSSGKIARGANLVKLRAERTVLRTPTELQDQPYSPVAVLLALIAVALIIFLALIIPESRSAILYQRF